MSAEDSKNVTFEEGTSDNTKKSKGPEWLVPDYPPLKFDDAVGKAAVEGQVAYYPRVVRSNVDPEIGNQQFCVFSVQVFKEERKFKTGEKCLGFAKVRGVYSDENGARRRAADLVREIDSRNVMFVAPVGHWLPITEEKGFAKDIEDVRMGEEEVHLRDQAEKEKIRKTNQIKRELREGEEELREAGDIYDDKESLPYYSMRRVTEMKLVEQRDIQRKQLEGLETTLRNVRRELKRLDRDYEQYSEQWIDVYNEERKKSGIFDFVPAEDQFIEYENAEFEDLDAADDDVEERPKLAI